MSGVTQVGLETILQKGLHYLGAKYSPFSQHPAWRAGGKFHKVSRPGANLKHRHHDAPIHGTSAFKGFTYARTLYSNFFGPSNVAPDFKHKAALRREQQTGFLAPVHNLLFGARYRRGVSSSIHAMSRRRRFRRKRKRGGSHTAYHLAQQAMKKVRRIEKQIEVKFFDIADTTQATIADAGTIVSLALIAQGNTRSTRDGNFISPFHLKMKIHWFGLAASTTELMRTIIFRDKRQDKEDDPTVPDVLAAPSVLAMFNAAHRKRWKILFDHTWTSPNDLAIRLNFFVDLRINLKLKMGFSGPATTDVNLNGLYMINIATETPSLTFTTRLFYNDL